MQTGNFVYGFELDAALTSLDINQGFDLAGDPDVNAGQWNAVATLRGRAGLAVGQNLFYTTAGLSFVDVNYAFGEPADPSDYTTYNNIEVGLAIGAGFEHAINENWTWRAEYLYVGLPRTDGGDGSNFGNDTGGFTSSAHSLRFGLSYSPGANDGLVVSTGDPMTAGDWSGWYAGFNGGAGITSSTALEYAGSVQDYSEYTIEDPHVVGGIQGGFNWQHGHTVVGLEADVSLSSFDRQDVWISPPTVFEHSGEWDWYATLRARAGVSAGNAMAYVTGGVALVDRQHSLSRSGPISRGEFVDDVGVGLALGAGVEMAFNDRWSARLEYLHINLAEQLTSDFAGRGDLGGFHSAANIGRFAINYAIDGNRPGSGATAPDTIDWTGVYAGLMSGVGIVNSTSTEPNDGPYGGDGEYSINDWSAVAGGLIGINGQADNFVYGLEADIAWSSFDVTHAFDSLFPPVGTRANTHQMNWLSTVRGRAGLAAGSSLIYATGGLALADMTYQFADFTNPEITFNGIVPGITVGAGVEHDFGHGWTGRMEAMHFSFESVVDSVFDPNNPVNFTTAGNMLRFGVTKRI